jgi:hypothetical protein
MADAITAAGGLVEDQRFVLRPGVFLTHQPETESSSPTMRAVARSWGLSEQSHFLTLAESSAVITYMNPDSRAQQGADYVRQVLSLGHHSIVGQSFVTLGLFGIPLEVVIELLSHGMDTTARLTSSAVKAMDDPLFCVFGPQPEQAKRLLIALLQTYREHGWEAEPRPAARELRNCHWPSSRAVLLLMGMRLIDWGKLLSKRCPGAGNEANLRYLCGLIAHTLRQVEEYALVIEPPERYGWEEDLWR